MKHRMIQCALVVLVGGAAVFGGELIAQATTSNAPHVATTSAGQSNTPPNLPEQVQVMGPNGEVAGTVPRSDLVGAPQNAAPGSPQPSAADTPGAYVVVDGHPGYPVTSDGALVGYWVPPTGFMSISQAQSAGAVAANGAPSVGIP
jgi:hypothetical protein